VWLQIIDLLPTSDQQTLRGLDTFFRTHIDKAPSTSGQHAAKRVLDLIKRDKINLPCKFRFTLFDDERFVVEFDFDNRVPNAKYENAKRLMIWKDSTTLIGKPFRYKGRESIALKDIKWSDLVTTQKRTYMNRILNNILINVQSF
jgi:hypothetical protein